MAHGMVQSCTQLHLHSHGVCVWPSEVHFWYPHPTGGVMMGSYMLVPPTEEEVGGAEEHYRGSVVHEDITKEYFASRQAIPFCTLRG